MITKEQAKNYCEEYSAGQAKMGNLKSLWKSLLFYCLPGSEHLVWSRDTDKGEYDVPADDTAIRSANTMASGIYSYTVTRGTRVADLLVQDPELNKDDDVQEYLSTRITKATQLIHASNYSSSIFDMLRHFVVLGTDLLFSYYDENLQKLNFRPYRVFDCWLQENQSGKIDRVLRSEKIPHTVAFERWGNKLPTDILKALENPEGVVSDASYLHIVEPNPDYIPPDSDTETNRRKAALAKHFKYREIWVHEDSHTVMSEGTGFRTFPYHVARTGVQVNQLPFGRSPAMDALPTMRAMHRVIQWFTDASECELRPPTILPKGSIDPEDWDDRPAARNVYNPVEGNKPERMSTVVSMQPMAELAARWTKAIEDFFFVPLFRALDQISGSNPTATEVQEASKQGIQGIAPVIGSLEPDVYTTIVERVLDLMDLYGLGPRKPDIIRDKDIVINVTTQLDAELQNADVRRTLVALGQCFEVMKQFTENAEMGSLVNRDRVIRDILYTNNVNPEAVYSTREAEERQEQLAAARQVQQMTDMATSKIGMIDPNKAPEPGSMAEGGFNVGG